MHSTKWPLTILAVLEMGCDEPLIYKLSFVWQKQKHKSAHRPKIHMKCICASYSVVTEHTQQQNFHTITAASGLKKFVQVYIRNVSYRYTVLM